MTIPFIIPYPGKSFLLTLILSFGLVTITAQEQSSYSVSDPRIKISGKTMNISYDISDAKASDRFRVKLVVNDKEGNEIAANSLSGDVGEDIRPGSDLRMSWDLEADNIEMEGDIFISVTADLLPPYRTRASGEQFNRTGLVLQSLPFPGLGMSRLTGDPHWIRGVAGYGCLAGSLVLNRMAVDSYEDFRNATTQEEASELLASAQQQDIISEILGYSAIGIWVIDIVWNIVGTAGLKDMDSYASRHIDIGAGYDQYSGAPLLVLSYKF